jgi:RNA polymerase primary sigma factor
LLEAELTSVRWVIGRNLAMAKQSILTEAKDTVVEAGKTAAEGVKDVATDALAAAAGAAAGVVAERVSQALRAGQKKVEDAVPSPQESSQFAAGAIKPARRTAAAKRKTSQAKKSATKSRQRRIARKTKRTSGARKTRAARKTRRKKSAKR